MTERKQWTADTIKAILDQSDAAVKRGLVVIHRLQTEDERRSGLTTERNGVGWSKFDAEVMTSLVAWYDAKGWLTPRQLLLARKKIKRYARQLARVANGEIEVPAA
jgi:hypothetical protein